MQALIRFHAICVKNIDTGNLHIDDIIYPCNCFSNERIYKQILMFCDGVCIYIHITMKTMIFLGYMQIMILKDFESNSTHTQYCISSSTNQSLYRIFKRLACYCLYVNSSNATTQTNHLGSHSPAFYYCSLPE